MMPYLNLDIDFFTHKKTLRLKNNLGDGAIPCLLRLWSYAAKHYPEDGIFDGLTDIELENVAGWTGERGILMLTLINLGFIDMISSNARIHDWKEHAGHIIAFKKRAKSAAYRRWNRYATSITKQQRQALPDYSTSNTPNLTKPNQTKLTKVAAKRQALEDFMITDELREWARTEFAVEIPNDVLSEFKDHWRKEPDKKLRLDWKATFQNNIRKLVGWNVLKPSSKTQSPQTGPYHKKVVL